MNTEPDKLKRDITIKLSVLARQLHKAFGKNVEKGLGFTRSQWGVIALVSVKPGATQRHIADQLEMSEAAAGRLIDRLCNEGVIERRPKKDDKRAYAIHLTATGQPITQQLNEIGAQQEAVLFKNIDENTLRSFSEILDKMYNNVVH